MIQRLLSNDKYFIQSDLILSTLSNLLMNFFVRLFNNLFKLSKIFATIVVTIAIIATNSCSYLQ